MEVSGVAVAVGDVPLVGSKRNELIVQVTGTAYGTGVIYIVPSGIEIGISATLRLSGW